MNNYALFLEHISGCDGSPFKSYHMWRNGPFFSETDPATARWVGATIWYMWQNHGLQEISQVTSISCGNISTMIFMTPFFWYMLILWWQTLMPLLFINLITIFCSIWVCPSRTPRKFSWSRIQWTLSRCSLANFGTTMLYLCCRTCIVCQFISEYKVRCWSLHLKPIWLGVWVSKKLSFWIVSAHQSRWPESTY